MSKIKSFLYYYKRIGLKGIIFFLKNSSDDIAKINYLYDNYYVDLKKEDYEKELKDWYYFVTNCKGDCIDNPVTFNEKIQWLKLNDSSKLKTLCADKYLVRKYVKEKVGEQYIINLLGVWDSASDIDFSKLPAKFVLKANHSSGQVLVVNDKSAIDRDETVKICNEWMKRKFGYNGMEMHYFDIPRKIIAEEFIEEIDGNLHDYKIHCYNGKPVYIQVIGDRDLSEHTGHQCFFDLEWNEVDIGYDRYPRFDYKIEKPQCFTEMIQIAEILSSDFKYVRVDLYEIKGKIIFGELTFTPANGKTEWKPEGVDLMLGKHLMLK